MLGARHSTGAVFTYANEDARPESRVPSETKKRATRDRTNLILRSRAQRGVSKDGQQQDCFPSFETR